MLKDETGKNGSMSGGGCRESFGIKELEERQARGGQGPTFGCRATEGNKILYCSKRNFRKQKLSRYKSRFFVNYNI